jgi:hypothetical protein
MNPLRTRSNHRTRVAAGLLVVGLVASAALVSAQFGRGRFGIRFAPKEMPDRSFTICRIMYQSVRSEDAGAGWQTDYPVGDNNLLIRFSELTRAPVSKDAGKRPNHWVVRLTDDALFDCPYTVASDVGTMGLRDDEVLRLRQYLLKGGFLWVDDFWGTRAWDIFATEMARVLPPAQYPFRDLGPDHPIYRTMFPVAALPQIPSIQFWRGSGGESSERGSDSAQPHLRGITDPHGHLLVLATHNTDISDAWEREGEDPEYFYHYSPSGYAVAVNVLLYAMSH